MRFLAAAALGLVAQAAYAQTVWRAADGPRTLEGTVTIPAGQTLTIEPGVVVNIKPNSSLKVHGTLLAQGTSTNKVRFVGGDNWSAHLGGNGTLKLVHADMQCKTLAEQGSSVLVSNTKFSGYGMLTFGDGYFMWARAPYVQLDRCSFVGQNSDLILQTAMVRLRNTTFSGGAIAWLQYAYVFLDAVKSTGAKQDGLTFGMDAPLFIDNVSVSNASGAGISFGGTNQGTNAFLGPNNVLLNNLYPVSGGGFLPGSTVPTTGNVNNVALFGMSGDIRGNIKMGALPVPYLVTGTPTLYGGRWEILPGATVKMAPGSVITIDVGDFVPQGRLGNPVRFEAADPTQKWGYIDHQGGEAAYYRHVVLSGSTEGIRGNRTYIYDSLFEDNDIATKWDARSQASVFRNNAYAYYGASSQNGAKGPNSYLNSKVAAEWGWSVDARSNWWGRSTGPLASQIEGSVTYKPFLTSAPAANAAPFVSLRELPVGLRPGHKITLNWEAKDDDGTIASQRVEFSPAWNEPANFSVVATIPAGQRSYEWVVPNIGTPNSTGPSYIRIVSIDEKGREGFDIQPVGVPANYIQGNVSFTSSHGGKVYRSGDRIPLSWTHTLNGNYSFDTWVFVDDRPTAYAMGGAFVNYGSWGHVQLPFVSSNRVRVGMRVYEGLNRYRWYFTPYFSVRPDPRIGDLPPKVSGVATSSGNYAPGSVVPISWTASDNEEVRSFDIFSSVDGGKVWTLVAEDLPGTTTSFDWQTAPGSGYNSVKVRVLARDKRFQITAADSAAFSLR